MSQIQDVAIVGGGAAGCAVAYYLAKAGVKSTIIERDGIAANASGYSAGGLNPLEGAGIPGPLGPLAIRSYRMHAELAPELTELSGVDFGYKVISSVRIAFDESELSEMQTTHDTFQSADADFSAEWLDASQLREMEPASPPAPSAPSTLMATPSSAAIATPSRSPSPPRRWARRWYLEPLPASGRAARG